MAIICAIVMAVKHDDTLHPVEKARLTHEPTAGAAPDTAGQGAVATKAHPGFSSAQNIVAMLFLIVFFFNILIMGLDFPRFTIVAMVLGAFAVAFFLMWLGVYINFITPVVNFLEQIYSVANAWFYALIALALLVNFGIIFISRYLDYWEILPNEILHNHGPWSDLERFPTTGLKFDKEIPDILEYALLRSGRLILHVPNERKAIVLDNVLWIDQKEEALKKLMSRMEVRITTDQETANEPL
jgi:hypothetical protein